MRVAAWFQVSGFRFQVSGFRFQVSGVQEKIMAESAYMAVEDLEVYRKLCQEIAARNVYACSMVWRRRSKRKFRSATGIGM